MKALPREKLIKMIEGNFREGDNVFFVTLESLFDKHADGWYYDRGIGDYVLTKKGKDL